MKVAVYVRVSTDSRDQANSFENQKKLFLDKIANDGDILYSIFADKGISGTQLNNREQFNLMLESAGIDVNEMVVEKLLPNGNLDRRVKRRKTTYFLSDRDPLFNCIYIKNTSRFARNTLSYEIVCLLRQKGVNIYFLEQNINTKDYSQDFLLQLWQVFDANDSRDKSQKVLTGLKQSAENNIIHTNKRIFGYSYSEIDNSLKQIPEEARIIKFIFDSYENGYGIMRIIKMLDEHGFTTRDGKSFCKTSISRILDNEKYAGLNQKLKWTHGKVFEKLSTPTIREEYDCVKNDRIDAIISEEQFYKCREIRESRHSENSVGIYKGVSKYCGKVICGHCRKTYYSDREINAHSVREFYRCKTKKSKGVDVCNSRNILESELDEILHSEMDNRKLEKHYESCLDLLNQNLQHIDDYYSSCSDTAIQSVQTQILDIKSRIKKLVSDYISNTYDEDIYKDLLSDLNSTLSNLQNKLKELQEPIINRDREKSLIQLRIKKIQNRLSQPFDEKDYLQCVRFLVCSNHVYVEYKVDEVSYELGQTLKFSERKTLGKVS